MSAATLGTKLLTKELMKKMRRTAGNGGRDPGVSALSRSIHRSAISVRSTSTSPMAAAIQRKSAFAAASRTSEGCAL